MNRETNIEYLKCRFRLTEKKLRRTFRKVKRNELIHQLIDILREIIKDFKKYSDFTIAYYLDANETFRNTPLSDLIFTEFRGIWIDKFIEEYESYYNDSRSDEFYKNGYLGFPLLMDKRVIDFFKGRVYDGKTNARELQILCEIGIISHLNDWSSALLLYLMPIKTSAEAEDLVRELNGIWQFIDFASKSRLIKILEDIEILKNIAIYESRGNQENVIISHLATLRIHEISK